MNAFYNFWINQLGYLNITILLIAGLMIVSTKRKVKLIACWLYILSNIIIFLRGYMTNVDSFISASLIFGALTVINMVRIYKQK